MAGGLIKSFVAVAALLAGISGASAQSCNSPSGFLKVVGPFTLGDVPVFGPDCQSVADSGIAGGGGTPGGLNTQVQYNHLGAFGGIIGATTDGTTLTLVAPILGTPASVTLTNATGVALGLSAGGVSVTDSTTLNANVPLTYSFGTNPSGLGTAAANYFINPLAGTLNAPIFQGAGTGLTGTGAGFTAGFANSVAATNITGTTLASNVVTSSIVNFLLPNTAAGNTISAVAASTGFLNLFAIENTGTSSNGATRACLEALIGSGSTVSGAFCANGGVTPQLGITSGAGMTAGMSLTTGAGNMNVDSAANIEIGSASFGTTDIFNVHAAPTGTGAYVRAVNPFINGASFSGTINFPDSATWASAGIRALTNLSVGANLAPDAPITINENTVATVAPQTGTYLHLVGADGVAPVLGFDGFAAQSTVLYRRADGTAGSKSAVGAAAIVGAQPYQTWDGAVYANIAQIRAETLNAQTPTDHSGQLRVRVVPPGSTSIADVMLFQSSGCISVGVAAGLVDCGIGSLNVSTHLLVTPTTAPTVSSCGTSPGTPSGSDTFGGVVAGTGILSSCVINFGKAFATAPKCVASSPTAIASLTVTASTTQLTVGGTSLTGDTINWICGSVS